jgi:hypothetical protein
MKTIDKLIFGLFFGFSFPLFFFLIAITFVYYFQTINPLYFVVTGLTVGLLTDVLFLKRLMKITFSLSLWIIIVFYLFYNICIYGFFMGFPVFNLVMGVIAGYYYGIRINRNGYSLSMIEFLKKRVPFYTGLVMLLICISTALIALSEKTIGLELQGMLGLNFEVTKTMIIFIILFGGSSLIITQYFLTRIVLTMTIKQRD